MGGNQSKAKTFNETLNEVVLDIMVSASSSASSTVIQTNEINISNIRGSKIGSFNQNNISKINFSILSTLAASGELQSQLQQALENSIKNNQNSVGYSASDTEIRNIVRNAINLKVRVESLSQLDGLSKQSNTINLGMDGAIIDSEIANQYQDNFSDIVSSLISDLTGTIMADLKTVSDVKNESETKQTNPISEAVNKISDTIGRAVNNLLSSTTYIIIAIILAGLGLIYMVGPSTLLKFTPLAVFASSENDNNT